MEFSLCERLFMVLSRQTWYKESSKQINRAIFLSAIHCKLISFYFAALIYSILLILRSQIVRHLSMCESCHCIWIIVIIQFFFCVNVAGVWDFSHFNWLWSLKKALESMHLDCLLKREFQLNRWDVSIKYYETKQNRKKKEK